ncbi:hypothetical protein DFQ28_008803 [Apophysomyces sp. BC1034]|nr:hypothetical protein DFQ30_008531 [Apophysomyces sp. BC1015]KAG0174434.1 hypothetical protein DFQ29_007501 [Apophysomyces sp. BC1021]KAG0185778.1 hypothetical protein DFQ28_008803 [Apophysomyces sp. BC1034]
MAKKIDFGANEVLKTQIDASIGIARSIVAGWLPPLEPGDEKIDDEEQEETFERYSTGRPDRLGLGAKYLSHAEATKHSASKEEMHLKNKILNQNRRATTKSGESVSGKRGHKDSSDEEEEESRTSMNRKKKQKLQQSTAPTVSQVAETKQAPQKDFLSVYLAERANKKKKKKKNKGTSTA